MWVESDCSAGAWDEQSDGCENEWTVVVLFLTQWLSESAAKGAAQGFHSLVQGWEVLSMIDMSLADTLLSPPPLWSPADRAGPPNQFV